MDPLRGLALLALLAGCSSPTRPEPDAGVEDAGIGPAPPALPVLTPCPAGWREVADASAGIVTCDPWPETGPGDCGADEAHFPGGPGCEPIGAACPAGDFAPGLPASTIHVLDGATGGDGSAADPFGTIADALAVAADGDVVALSKGTFEELVSVRDAVTIAGACVAQTAIVPPGTSDTTAAVTLFGPATIRDVRIGGDRPGIGVESRETARVESVLVEDVLVAGLSSIDGSVVADRIVVRGTRPSGGFYGIGLAAMLGGTVEVSRAVVEGGHSEGALIVDPGSLLALSDSVVRDTLAEDGSGRLGRGVEAFAGASVSLTRVAIEGNRSEGVVAYEAGTTMALTDVVVRGTLPADVDERHGYGIEIAEGASADVLRTWLVGNHAVGLLGWAAGSSIHAADVVVSDTVAQRSDGEGGFGAQVGPEATMELARVAFVRNRGIGVSVFGDLTGSDVLVRDTGGRARDGEAGDGMQARDGAQVSLERSAFETNRRFGISAYEAGTFVSLVDLRVIGTLEQECAATGCVDEGGGTGLTATQGAAIDVLRFLVSDSALCGVQVSEGGTIDLHEGVVANNEIGANVQTAGFDPARLEDGVRWIDNATTLDAAALPVPSPIEELR